MVKRKKKKKVKAKATAKPLARSKKAVEVSARRKKNAKPVKQRKRKKSVPDALAGKFVIVSKDGEQLFTAATEGFAGTFSPARTSVFNVKEYAEEVLKHWQEESAKLGDTQFEGATIEPLKKHAANRYFFNPNTYELGINVAEKSLGRSVKAALRDAIKSAKQDLVTARGNTKAIQKQLKGLEKDFATLQKKAAAYG